MLKISRVALLVALSCCSCATIQEKHYELARRFIEQTHQAALFGPEAPWLLQATPGTPAARQEYLSITGFPEACLAVFAGSMSTEALFACRATLNRAFLQAIEEKYFAATEDQISSRCEEHYIACGDPLAFEYIVRSVHNDEIRKSENAKLRRLERWLKGDTTDDELLSSLGRSSWVELENPELVVVQPPSAVAVLPFNRQHP